MSVNADVAEFVPSPNSKVTRKVVRELNLPKGMTIGGLVRNGEGMLVSGNTQIEAGDSVVVFCYNVDIKKGREIVYLTMLNLRLISKILGSLLWIEGVLMLVCLFVAILYQGTDIMPFVWSILITLGAGLSLRLLGRNADNLLGRRDAYFVVTVSWIFLYALRYTTFYVEWWY